MPSFDGGDDFVQVLRPGKGFWVCVGFAEEAMDGILELLQGSEHAALEPFLTRLAKKPSKGLTHEAEVGVK